MLESSEDDTRKQNHSKNFKTAPKFQLHAESSVIQRKCLKMVWYLRGENSEYDIKMIITPRMP